MFSSPEASITKSSEEENLQNNGPRKQEDNNTGILREPLKDRTVNYIHSEDHLEKIETILDDSFFEDKFSFKDKNDNFSDNLFKPLTKQDVYNMLLAHSNRAPSPPPQLPPDLHLHLYIIPVMPEKDCFEFSNENYVFVEESIDKIPVPELDLSFD